MSIGTTTSPSTICRLFRERRPWRSGIPLCLCIIFWLLLTTAAPLWGQRQEPHEKSHQGISDFKGEINQLQRGILQQEEKVTETQVARRNILSELETLDKKIAKQQEKLQALEIKMLRQQGMIDREEENLRTIRTKKDIVENHLKKRITAYYTMGDIGLLNATFSTKTLPELLTFHDAFEVLIEYDQKLIKVFRATIDQVVRAKTALDLEKSILEEFLTQTIQEKEKLQKTKSEQQALLAHIRTQEKLHKQAIIEMQQASENLAASIVKMKKKSPIIEQSFLADKGRLPPPVNGKLITLFHQEKANKLGISRKSEGIEIQAPDGTDIVSVSDGEVVFSGYLRGYGNTVIIHHGYQYYTVTSRIEKIVVEKGQKVKRKDRIGVMGDTATLFDEGLYFEIRHERESMDPLVWLRPGGLARLRDYPTY
jgi:septal ring factor EnvC (AmiA/AmiB activator)